ncbi:GntR family transcriptional regulator [Nocardia terpenica]|nr:GntR family transcriptional regulator [Nocardia terpenica]MBF6106218.1 GntR family transcriptional regulator [Nocardia terpenica]MBF6110402.1 GntR family transcriptional regulator [Nocardia terpenica]MBF6120761.1 GntR family transcriptional regulator [Nocardia terpenica]MBF6151738.1 GntR family transcriptional regulator [Nocardia terpenica]
MYGHCGSSCPYINLIAKSSTTAGEPVPLTNSDKTPARPLLREAGLPLWRQLQADLRRRLREGEFTEQFPGELELRDEYGVSRHTVREALRALREEGMVTATRGRPAKLAAPGEITQPLGALYSLFASVEAADLRQRSIVRRLDARHDAYAAVRLGLEESTPLIYLERLRLADEQPLAIDCAWLPAALARPLLDADFSHTSLYDELAARCGVRLTGGQEQIRAVVPTAAQQRLLDIGPETAAMKVERMGTADGTPVEWRTSLIRGDRFSVVADFSARSGYSVNLAAPRDFSYSA